MKIKSIKLEDFKTYKSATINCDSDFNVIIGPNNVGKSTIIEAILLWQSCLRLFIQEKNNKKLYVGTKDKYLIFNDLYFIRISNDSDLFYGSKKSACLTLKLFDDANEFNLSFNIGKPESIKDSYFKVNYKNSIKDFERFTDYISTKGLNFNNLFYTYQTKPISQIVKKEPFYNEAQILKKISLAQSNELLRNKILKSRSRNSLIVKERFQYLESKLEAVLGHQYAIKWKNSNLQDDEHVKISIKPENSKEVDISLMGSGFLQVIEIFSTLQFISNRNNCLNVILIDEPDSHIHSNLQVNLLNELLEEENLQIFIITHNDSLIDSVAARGNILYINDDVKKLGHINKSSQETFDFIKNELSSKLQQIKRQPEKLFYIVSEDENFDYIKSYFELNGFDLNKTEFISYFGCDTIGSAIAIGKYAQNLNSQAKVIIHRDRDYLADDEVEELRTRIERENMYFFVTDGVDIESQFINAQHINFLYPTLSLESIETLIVSATDETEEDSLDRILKKFALQKKSGVKYLKLYENDKVRYRYGKKVLSRLKGKMQPIILSNPNFLQFSEFIQSKMLASILNLECLQTTFTSPTTETTQTAPPSSSCTIP